jgi:hypothetical protein
MNIRGKCVNRECSRFGIEELYTPLMLAGLSLGKDRVKCPECGDLLQTSETADASGRRPSGRSTPARPLVTRRRGPRKTRRRSRSR